MRLEETAEAFLSYALTRNRPSEVASKRTIVRLHLLPAFGAVDPAEIDTIAIEDFCSRQIAAGLKAKTVNNQLAVLHRWLSRLRLRERPRMPWLKVIEPDYDWLELDERALLLERADDKWQPAIAFAVTTGLRAGELLALRWREDVSIEGSLVTVHRSVWNGLIGPPKGGKARDVALCATAAAALRKQWSRRLGPLVFHREGAMLTRHMLKWPLWRACDAAGLRRIRWHVLRHTFATNLAERGIVERTRQKLLGHTTAKMTARYSHVSDVAMREAVRVLDG